jgi:hypothetical protein
LPWSDYKLTVNGRDDFGELGHNLEVASYCQMRVTAHTNDIGYARMLLRLEPVKTVIAPAAAFYSNTAYTEKVAYKTSSSHCLTFAWSEGGNGFMTSRSWTVDCTWTIYKHHTAQFGKRYYAAGVYDETGGSPKVATAGLSAPVSNELFTTMDVPEYLTLDSNKENYGLPKDVTAYSFVLGESESASFEYTEAGSFTWSYGFTGSVGIDFVVFSIDVNIDITETTASGCTNVISFDVLLPPEETSHHRFVFYTRGFNFIMPNDKRVDSSNRGGAEFHIWDAGVVT